MNTKIGTIQLLAGEILGYIDKPWEKLVDTPSKISINDALRLEGNYVIQLNFSENEKMIYSSLSGGFDLFYSVDSEGWIDYDYNFWEIAKRIRKISWDYNECLFFEQKGYLRPGKTLFNEIKRVELGCGIYIKGKEYKILGLNRGKWDIDYNKFLSTIKNSINMNLNVIKEQKNALLFSGGKDSAMLALLLNKEFDVPVALYSAEYVNPKGFSMNAKDVERCQYYSEFLHTPVTKVEVDCHELIFDDIKYLVKRMPFGAHPASIFEFLLQKIEKDLSDVVIWTGQNADTVYGMGNTDSNISTSIVRYFLTDSYLKSFSDTNDQLLGKVIAEVICGLYFFSRKKRLYRPHTSAEYIEYAMNGKNFLGNKKSTYNKVSKGRNIEDIRHIVWDNYQSAHLTGMDHQVIRNVGNDKICRIFPYSTVCSMMMFRNMHYGVKDILTPKRYISRYLEECLGEKIYRKLYPMAFKLGNDDVVTMFENKVINETNYGKSLQKYSKNNGNTTSIQELVSRAWESEIQMNLSELDINILK